MSEARAHHFISQCYLRGFTLNGSKKSKLCVVSLAEVKSFESKPDGVAHRRDFNRVEGLSAGAVESALSGFEGVVDSALKQIRQDRSLANTEAWNHVLNLVALFAVRHPLQREQTSLYLERMMKMILDLITATPDRWNAHLQRARASGAVEAGAEITYEQARDFVKRDEFTIDVPTARHIGLEFSVHDAVLQTLANRRWRLLLAGPDAGSFVTSDRPVLLGHSDGSEPSLRRPLGHGLSGTSVFFPINREMMAVGTFEGEGGTQELTPRGVALYNGLTLWNAHREVYGPDWRSLFSLNGGKIATLKELPDLVRALKKAR